MVKALLCCPPVCFYFQHEIKSVSHNLISNQTTVNSFWQQTVSIKIWSAKFKTRTNLIVNKWVFTKSWCRVTNQKPRFLCSPNILPLCDTKIFKLHVSMKKCDFEFMSFDNHLKLVWELKSPNSLVCIYKLRQNHSSSYNYWQMTMTLNGEKRTHMG